MRRRIAYYYLWRVCVLDDVDMSYHNTRNSNAIHRSSLCPQMAGPDLSELVHIRADTLLPTYAIAPSHSEVKWQLNTYISFIFLMKFPYSITPNAFAYVLERAYPRIILLHIRANMCSVYMCSKRSAPEWIWSEFVFFLIGNFSSARCHMPGPRRSAAQQIHSTIFQRVTPARQKTQEWRPTESVRMWKRNKVFNTIPNPNILCLYITQVISYIRNKNLSYFPSYILCAHIKYHQKMSACLIRRSWSVCVCGPLPFFSFVHKPSVMRARLNINGIRWHRIHKVCVSSSTPPAPACVCVSQFSFRSRALMALSSTSTLFMCYIH